MKKQANKRIYCDVWELRLQDQYFFIPNRMEAWNRVEEWKLKATSFWNKTKRALGLTCCGRPHISKGKKTTEVKRNVLACRNELDTKNGKQIPFPNGFLRKRSAETNMAPKLGPGAPVRRIAAFNGQHAKWGQGILWRPGRSFYPWDPYTYARTRSPIEESSFVSLGEPGR